MATLKNLFRGAASLVLRKSSEILKTPGSTERLPIWSVTVGQAGIFFTLVFWLWFAAIGYLVYDCIVEARKITPEIVMATVVRFGTMVIPIAAIAMVLSAMITKAWERAYKLRRVFAVKILDKLHEKLVEPLLAAGRAEGRTEGHTEGRAEGITEYRDWQTRKEEAEAKGKPFDEPPPEATTDEPPEK